MRNGSDATWAAEDTFLYRLMYAPDFSNGTVSDEEYEYGTPETDPFHFVWDISSYVRTGANSAKIQSNPRFNFSLRLKDVVIEIGESMPSLNINTNKVHESFGLTGNAGWDPSLNINTNKQASSAVEPSPTGSLPVYMPKGIPGIPSSIEVSSTGKLRFKMGQRDFGVRSRTSIPEGKWSDDVKKEDTWKPLQRGESVVAKWQGADYTVERKITLHPDHIAVADTIRNTGDQLVGLIFENRLDLPENPKRVLIAGRAVQKHLKQRSSPAHPTAMAEFENLVIGLVAEDDIFRIHAKSFAEEGVIGLSDPQLGIAPGKAHTLEWSIYMASNGDYWDFVNAIRRNWGSNATLQGPSKWVVPAAVPAKADQFAPWSQKASMIVLCNPTVTRQEARQEGDEKVSLQFGTAFLMCKTWCENARNAMRKIKEADPKVETFIYTHPNLCTEPGHEQLYQDSRALNIAGGVSKTAYIKSPSLFMTTLGNSYGKALMETYKFIVEELDCNVYIDEITASPMVLWGAYDEWDGCTVVIDKASHAVKGKRSSAILLQQPWRAALLEYLGSKGKKMVIANGSHYTRTMLNWKNLQCFNEGDLGNDLVVDSHLSHPLCLAQPYGGNTPERMQTRYKAARGLLDRGGILFTAFSAEFPMFPITPVELHSGYVIGKERILTNRSGQFGWGDDSSAEVHVFDGQGKRVEKPDVKEVRMDKQVLTEIRMPSDHMAILVRNNTK